MDYCYTCRRHLNGAFSCPGCGTPADALQPPQVAETARLPVVTDADDLPLRGPGGGRAAARGRQRRQARRQARSRQQRVAVYGVGAVAVVGALTMFSMAALSGGGSDTPPDAPGIPDAATTAPQAPAPATPTDEQEPSAAGATATGSPSPSAAPSTRTPTASPSATRPRQTATAPPTATSSPTPTKTSHKPTRSPRPTPSETCRQVLWWCED